MTDSQDPKSRAKPAVPTVGAPEPSGEKRSGRVSYDERGNSVWEWQLETGVYSRDVSTQRLRKLELGELSIAETALALGKSDGAVKQLQLRGVRNLAKLMPEGLRDA